MPQRVDFSGNSKIYDQRHGAVITDQLARALANRLRRGDTIVDIGAGTGRVAVALAGNGFQVVAADPAVAMMQTMQQKSGEVLAVAAEGACLPFRRHSVDAVILARLLYLVADWQGLLREAMEILKPRGILFHEWGNGDASEAWVQVREKARALLQEAGIENPFHPGARSEGEVDSCLRELGFQRREQIKAGTGPSTTLAEFLDKMQSGEFSYLWNIPKEVQDFCLPQLRLWCESKFDLYQPAPMPAELHWVVYENAG